MVTQFLNDMFAELVETVEQIAEHEKKMARIKKFFERRYFMVYFCHIKIFELKLLV